MSSAIRRRNGAARSVSTTRRRRSGSSSTARRAPARRTWTGCGRRRTSWRSSSSRRVNRSSLALAEGWWRVPLQLPRTLAHRARRNTKGQARRNITAHYDLGNEFYRLFLDESMTYSSAIFETPEQSLADAQRTKYRRMAERAGLRRGQHVLEIGSGLGRVRPVRRWRARLSRHVHHHLARAARSGARARPSRRARGPRRHPAARLSRHRGHVRRRRLDRDARGRRRGVLHDVLRGGRCAHCGREARRPSRSSPSRTSRTTRNGAAPTGSRRTSSRAGCVPRSRSSNGRCTARGSSSATWPTSARATPAPSAPGGRASWASSTRSGPRASTQRFIRMWEYYLALSEAGFATGLSQDLQITLEKGRGLG